MSKFSQLLKMVKLLEGLEGGVYMTTERLGLKLGVSPRMIRKYITDLKEAGIPIKNKPGPKGGIYLNEITEEYII